MNAHRSIPLTDLPALVAITALALHMELPWAREALEGAAARGPTPVERSEQKDSAYVATFQGGSSVWMRAMRTRDRS